MKGVDLRTVQELMGHKTMAMTLRYSHLSPEYQLDAVQRLNAPRNEDQTSPALRMGYSPFRAYQPPARRVYQPAILPSRGRRLARVHPLGEKSGLLRSGTTRGETADRRV
jgi:hypothetical protein